jgi:hypothetical protein
VRGRVRVLGAELRGVDVFQSREFVAGANPSPAASHVLAVTSAGGLTEWLWDEGRYSDPAEIQRLRVAMATPVPTWQWFPGEIAFWILPDRTFGFGHQHRLLAAGPTRHDSIRVVAPWWSFVLATLIAPVLCVRLALRNRRRGRGRIGLCPARGYDLRASQERCPECGTLAKPGVNA